MTILGWIGVAAKLLPLILSLIQQFKSSADAKEQRGLGRAEAEKEALEELTSMMKVAKEVEEAAAKDHATIKDDNAFDREFERK